MGQSQKSDSLMTRQEQKLIAEDLIECIEGLIAFTRNGDDAAAKNMRKIMVRIIIKLTEP